MTQIDMRHIIILFLLVGLSSCISSAQYKTKLTVTNMTPSIAQNMGINASVLLTELNHAFLNGKTPQLTKINGMSKEGKSSILAMWEMTPFHCVETEIIERCYKTPSGYQIRNIPIFLKDMSKDVADKEIVINFDKFGNIDDVYFALDLNNYKAIMNSENNDVTDLSRRQAILNFVEKLQNAYFLKDIDLPTKVFGDDALIITGNEIKQTKAVENGIPKDKIEYQVQTKKEYINKLYSIFKNNTRINVVFDSIEVVQHPQYPDIYGLSLFQGWNTTNYSDAGYWFFMIDFDDNDNMQIHVRVWQPAMLNGKPLSEAEKFKLGDFEILNK